MRETTRDIEGWRFPVWQVLSEFFLDTALIGADYRRIAGVLAASPYSEAELDAILRYEVYPPCHWNLLGVAGIWDAFGDDWIATRIAPRCGQRPLWRGRPPYQWMYRDCWSAVRAHFRVLKGTQGDE